MILITSIWIICISICNGNIPSKLYGGTQVGISEYPYVVSLQWKGVHQCGGSIISLDTIITSASCVVIDTVPLIYQSNLQVLIGTNNNLIRQGNGVIHSVKYIIPHEYYNPRSSWVDDLALLKLETPIVPFYNEWKALKIPQRTSRSNRMATLGWGGTNELHKLYMRSETIRNCNEIFASILFFKNSKGCLTPIDPHTNILFGDSGNPLIQGKFIVGVISVFNPINPAIVIFTKIYPYRTWIQAITESY